jgi:hypothetical protein
MADFWGVDSLVRADRPVGNMLYDFIKEKIGAPNFWGRYIGGVDPKFKLTDEEVLFLHQQNCSILLVYKLQESRIKMDFFAGKTDAENAIAALQSLHGWDPGTCIYGDIEPTWSVSKDWLIGWWHGMDDRKQVHPRGGLYANFKRGASGVNGPYRAALADDRTPPGTVAFSNLWVQTPNNRTEMEGIKSKLACNANPSSVDFTLTQPDGPDDVPPFASLRPSVCIWQYALKCFVKPDVWQIDRDVATDRGFRTMWHPHRLINAPRRSR